MTDLLSAHLVDWPPLGGPQSVEVVTRSRGVRKANNNMKTCTKCGEDKPESGFYRRADSSGKSRGTCISCMARYRAMRAAEFPDVVKAQKLRSRIKHRESIRRKTRQRRKGNEVFARKLREVSADLRKNSPNRWRALKAINVARRAGRIGPASNCSCDSCGNQASDWHHDSYLPGRELDVRPLCRSCHMLWHRDNEAAGDDRRKGAECQAVIDDAQGGE